MTLTRRPITVDDPTGPAAPTTPAPVSTSSEAAPKPTQASATPPASAPTPSPVTRWGGSATTTAYRLPGDMVDELAERVHELGLPVGLTVAAAVDQLLALPDEDLTAVVRAAESARRLARPDRRVRRT